MITNIKYDKMYYLVDEYFTVSNIPGEIADKLDVKKELLFENYDDASNQLLKNLEEYVLNETDEYNKDVALFNIEQVKLKISNPEHFTIFKIFKGQE